MTFSLPPELEHHVNELIVQGTYPSAEAVVAAAIEALVREQERQRIESLLEENGVDGSRVSQLLQEAEDSGDYDEMTSQDWTDIEREALAAANVRKSR